MLFWLQLGAIFAHFYRGFLIFSDFLKVFRDFAQILTDFSRIFTKSKILGVRLHPRLLHQWCSIKSECYDKC